MSYFRYINSIYGRTYKQQRRAPGPKGVIVPGCVCDPDTRKKFKHKFDKWYEIPRAAHKLYWRTHKHPYSKHVEHYWSEVRHGSM